MFEDQKKFEEMTEQEAKEFFGYAFKRDPAPSDAPEAYVCTVNPSQYGSGYGVISRELDPWCYYNMEDLKKYMEKYPEMVTKGWLAPPTPEEVELQDIRTNWVNLTTDQLKQHLYSNLTKKFKNDDIWEGTSDEDLIVWREESITCDRASQYVMQYAGDDNEKAQQVETLRNDGKNYIRTVVEKFYTEHHGKPEPIVIPERWIQ